MPHRSTSQTPMATAFPMPRSAPEVISHRSWPTLRPPHRPPTSWTHPPPEPVTALRARPGNLLKKPGGHGSRGWWTAGIRVPVPPRLPAPRPSSGVEEGSNSTVPPSSSKCLSRSHVRTLSKIYWIYLRTTLWFMRTRRGPRPAARWRPWRRALPGLGAVGSSSCFLPNLACGRFQPPVTRTQTIPSTCSKCPSAETRSAPVSIA